ncbi:unnamed protein product [Withania somnifera]
MINAISPSTSGARNIHVMLEFLLVILTDFPMDSIHHDKLFDLLARVGELTRKVSTAVHELEDKSRNEGSTNETSCATVDLLENIELLMEELKHVYLKAPDSCQWCFPMSDGLLFIHLLVIHLNDLLDSDAYSISLIKKEIELVKGDLEFIRLFFVNAEQGLYNDLRARVLDVAYEAKDVIDSIILTRGSADLDVISITGMPGSGKTTLAYRVYNDESVSSHFDFRAWCSVGKECDEKKLLEKVYNQVVGLDSEFSEGIDVADELRKQLFSKRYLIVLDDLWDTATWDELTRPFPKVKKGSRIILTTREMKVALYGMCNTDPLKLRLLKPEESWELLEKRAFGKESCPDELLDVGKKIAQNCKGLPLVADLIAGVIAGLEKKKTVWLDVLNNLSSFILNNEVDMMKVIELSYDHLPVHLKPCFLYLASRPKDREISVNVLKLVCSVEGLVQLTKMNSAEELMEVFLDNLICSSLVILFNEIGQFATCQLHDLVHDFCLKKQREEKFFDLISSSAPSSSSDLMPRIVTIKYDKKHFGLNNFVLFSSKKKRHSGKHFYSLRIKGDKLDDHLSDICHLGHLRLLRMLHLDSSFIKVKDSLLNKICMLNHLRFLRISTEVKYLPSSFSNLWNLETLVVNIKGSTLVLLPRIWDLVKLRLLRVSSCSFFDMDRDEPILIAEDTKLGNLRFLGDLVLFYSKDTMDIFKRFPNLQRLVFVLKELWDYSTKRHWFPKLDFLTELEQLRVEFESSNTNDSGPFVETNWSWDFHFPSNLKKLWLFDFPLTSDSLSTIGRLANLEELFLIRTIIQGQEWYMGKEDNFEKLKFLKLREVNLAKWEFGEESFPVLEKLELWRCHKLEKIPRTFGDIYSLKFIKLVQSPQLQDSAKNIKEYVENLTGEDKLQILGPNNIPLFK